MAPLTFDKKDTSYLFIKNATNAITDIAVKGGNTADMVRAALQNSLFALSGIMDFSGKAANDADEATQNLGQTQKATEEKTKNAIEQYRAIIEEKAAIIKANIEKADEANEKKTEIEKKLSEQLGIIDSAAAFLNGEEESFTVETTDDNGNKTQKTITKRTEALEAIKAAGAEISGLVELSAQLTQTLKDCQANVDEAQSSISSTKLELDNTVVAATNELQQENASANAEQERNNSNNEQGNKAIEEGEEKIAAADAASTGGGLLGLGSLAANNAAEELRRQGQELVDGGTKLTESAQTNLPKLGEIKTLISTDLTKFQADYNSIGSLAAQAYNDAFTVNSKIESVGSWVQEFDQNINTESKVLNQSIESAAKNPIFEMEAKGDGEAIDGTTESGEKIFNYDTNNLKRFVGSV